MRGRLQDVAVGWTCTVQGVQLAPMRDTTTARENQRRGAGKRRREQSAHRAPRQPHPGDNEAHPLITRRARARQLARAGGGRIFLGWEGSIPASQPQRQEPRQAGSGPSHRYFHGLTSALPQAGGLFSKSKRSCSCTSAKGLGCAPSIPPRPWEDARKG